MTVDRRPPWQMPAPPPEPPDCPDEVDPDDILALGSLGAIEAGEANRYRAIVAGRAQRACERAARERPGALLADDPEPTPTPVDTAGPVARLFGWPAPAGS